MGSQNFKGEHKIWLKIQHAHTYNIGLVGVTSQNFSMQRAMKQA